MGSLGTGLVTGMRSVLRGYIRGAVQSLSSVDTLEGKFISLVDLNLVSGSSDLFRHTVGGYFFNLTTEDGILAVPPPFRRFVPLDNPHPDIYSIVSYKGTHAGGPLNRNIEWGTTGLSDFSSAGIDAFLTPDGDERDLEGARGELVVNQETILPYVRFVCQVQGDPTSAGYLGSISTGDTYWKTLFQGGNFDNQEITPIYTENVYDDHYTHISLPYQKINKKVLESGASLTSISEITYEYNTYNTQYQDQVAFFDSIRELPNWYTLNMLAQFPDYSNSDIEAYYGGNDMQLHNTALHIIDPEPISGMEMPPEPDSAEPLIQIGQNIIQKDSILSERMANQQKNLLFNSNAARNFLNKSSLAATSAPLAPFYSKYNLNTAPTGIYGSFIQDEKYSTHFLRSLKEVFLQQTDGGLPLQATQFMRNVQFLQSSVDSSIDKDVASSDSVMYPCVDFVEMLLYARNKIKNENDDFTVIDDSTLRVRSVTDDKGVYRALNARDNIRVFNKTLDTFQTDMMAFSVNDVNTIMNLQKESTNFEVETSEDVNQMYPQAKHSEVIAYRVEKIGGSVSGDSSTQSVLQNFWIFNDSELDDLSLIDLQVKYGAEYTYRVYAYYLVKGIKYKFSDLQLTRIVGAIREDSVITSDSDALTGLEPGDVSVENPITGYCVEYYDPTTGEVTRDLLDGVYEGTDSSVMSSVALEDTVRIKISAAAAADNPHPPYIANFIVTAQPSLKLFEVPIDEKALLISDHVPNKVNVDPSYILNNSNTLVFNVAYQPAESKPYPAIIDPDEISFRYKYLKSNDIPITDPLEKVSVSPVRYVDIYRIDHKPTSYTDFDDKLLKTIDNKIQDKNFAYKTCVFNDTVKSNTKYYYLFKTRNALGVPGRNSQIIEAELINDGGYKYASFEVVSEEEMQINRFKNVSENFKRLIQLTPPLSQVRLDTTAVDYSQTAASQYGNVKVGSAEELIWNKTFKLRLTSKKTGKKIDLNITYSDPSVKLEE